LVAIADVARPVAAGRLAALDAVRGIALVAMAIYHFAFDLATFGLIRVDVAGDLGWKLLARATAGTFLLVVGVNLVLATRRGLRPRPFLRRLAVIAAAAALVSLGTWFADPRTFVYFGILHAIAVSSVLAVPFLALPAWLNAAIGAVVVVLGNTVALLAFDSPWLLWIGMAAFIPPTVDYVPLFPWFGVVLLGVAAGRLLAEGGGDTAFARWVPAGAPGRLAVLAGRWSLLIYLVHQPLFYGLLYACVAVVAPAAAPA
jgi:uncharacterized membrane protein